MVKQREYQRRDEQKDSSDKSTEKGRGYQWLFTDKDVDILRMRLDEILQTSDISWEFDQSRGLVVTGILPNEDVIFTHPRSARAGLDMYVLGYNNGFGDARNRCEREVFDR